MTAYDPISDPNGQVLGILYVGIRKVEFLESADDTFWSIIYSTLAIASLAMLVSYLVARGAIVRPLKASVATMNCLAQGDLSVETPEPRRSDEIGEIMTALVVFKKTGLEVERMRADRLATEQHAAEQRKADMSRMADAFEGAVGEIVETVSSAATELEASAKTLTATAERSQELAIAGCGGLGRGFHQRAVGGLRQRGTDGIGQRDQPSGPGIRKGRQFEPWIRRRRPTIASANCRRRQPASATWSN